MRENLVRTRSEIRSLLLPPARGGRRRRAATGGGLPLGILSGALVLLAVACAAPRRKAEAPVFFPPAPELPRIQYLTSFSGLKDIEEQSAFSRFVVGDMPDQKVDKPYGVAVHDGRIYVCDTNGGVAVFDLKAGTFGLLKGAVGRGMLRQPVNISIEPDGTKYVADPVRGQIVVFDRNDEYLKAYGAPGGWRPVDAVPFENKLYVADVQNGLVKVFDRQSGDAIGTIGDTQDPSGRLDRPTNLAVDRDGFVYVSDAGRFQVVKFDREGRFQAAFGRLGDNLGHFARPKGIALDRDGHLYAVDASFNNVQIFNERGRLLMFFGKAGDEAGDLLLPAKVAIDYDNLQYFQQYVRAGFRVEYLVLVTSQFAKRRVSIFGFGREEGARYPGDEELLQQVDERKKKVQEKPQTPAEPPSQPRSP